METILNLAYFPLGLFKLPGETLELHLFEPRYKQLADDLISGALAYFGIPFSVDLNGKKLGCLAELKKVIKKYPDGRYDLKIEITGIFEILDYQESLPGKLYAGGLAKQLDFEAQVIDDERLMEQLHIMKDTYPIYFNWVNHEPLTDIEILGSALIPDLEKLQYMQLYGSFVNQQNFLLYQLQRIACLLMQENAVNKGFCLN